MLPDLLFERATEQPNAVAVATQDRSINWKELAELVAGRAKRLRSDGVRPNDRIGHHAVNSADYIISLLALLRMQSVAVLFNHRYSIEMATSLADSLHCRMVQIESSKETSIITQQDIPSNQPAVVVFTSGTTSTPKAALLSYGNLYYNALGSNERLPFRTGDRWLLSLPLYHVGGLGIVFRALVSGGTIIVPDSSMTLAESVNRFQPTHLSLVPTQLHRLLPEKIPSVEQLTAVLMGGAPLSSSLTQKALDAGLPIYASYGLTEMGSQVCTKRITKTEDSIIGCGSPLNYREMQLSNSGEVLVKGETLFHGYIESDNSLRLPLTSDGWFPTGDIGYLDDTGSLHITGRKDNMFISGGENIYPEEIEAALLQIDGIAEAIVVPVADPEFGSRPVALVRLENSTDSNTKVEERIKAALLLPRYKLPIRIFNWPTDLPTNQMKLSRQEFKNRADALLRSAT